MFQKSYKHKNKLLPKLSSILTILFTFFLLIGVYDDAFAAKKKKKKKKPRRVRIYNPPQTKANAIARLQTSNELSELAKIEPTTSTNSESQAYQKKESVMVSNEDTTRMLSDVEILKTFLSADEMVDNNGDKGEDLAELQAEDDIKINLDDFRSIWLLAIGAFGDGSKTSYGVEKEAIMDVIMKWIGTPYRFGGISKKAIDCSAWVRAVFFQVDSIILPRTAREQFCIGRNIPKQHLEFGDIVFFHTYSRKFASHVGIYLGDNLFAHASSAEGVTVSSLNSTFYNNRFIGGRRLSESDLYAYKALRGTVHNNILEQ
jgi:hypothetical protein